MLPFAGRREGVGGRPAVVVVWECGHVCGHKGVLLECRLTALLVGVAMRCFALDASLAILHSILALFRTIGRC